MAAPTILQVYPADGDVGIPVGESIEIIFDRGVDLSTIRNHIVLYGQDFDRTSGPDSTYWVDPKTSDNPYYLKSPGFKGTVELKYSVSYVDLNDFSDIDPGVITSEADELAYGVAGAGHKIIVTPVSNLAPDVEYTLFISGDPSTAGTGVSRRTVFDTEEDPGNTSTTGTVLYYGGYTGATNDTLNIRITTSGDIGTAKYRWWLTSEGEGSAITGRLTARRFRSLIHGVEVRFDGSGFVAGDLYSVNLEQSEKLATNTQVKFTTNDGTYTEAPDSPSTPATSVPPASIWIPGVYGNSSEFYLVEMDPEDGSYNNSLSKRTFTLVFSEELDPATIDNATVRVYLHDVNGYYDRTSAPLELQKVLSVDGNVLTISI